MGKGVNAVWVAALAGVAVLSMMWPCVAHAQINDPKPGQGAPAPAPAPPPAQSAEEAIVPDAEFEASMPAITGDIDAPLDPLAPAPNWQKIDLLGARIDSAFEAIVTEEPEFNQPLPALAEFEVNPAIEIAGVKDGKTVVIFYTNRVEGLDAIDAEGRFEDLSALRKGKGKAANAAMIAARAREDERLAVQLM